MSQTRKVILSQRYLQLGFVLAMCLLLFTALAPIISAGWVEESDVRYLQTAEQMEQLQLMLSSLKYAESGTQGYLITGRQEYLQPYYQGNEQAQGLLTRLRRTLRNDTDTLRSLELISRQIDILHQYQGRVIEQRRLNGGTPAYTDDILSGKLGMDRLRFSVTDLRSQLNARKAVQYNEYQSRRQLVNLVVVLVTVLDAVLFSLLLWQIFLGIRERARTVEELQEVSERMQLGAANLEERNRHMALLSKMSSALQVCQDAEEFFEVAGKYAYQLFGQHAGALYAYYSSRDLLERMTSWGQLSSDTILFEPNQCWAIRRGQPHAVRDLRLEPVCQHLGVRRPDAYLCLPLMAGGEPVGILYLEAGTAEVADAFPPELLQVANTLTEQVALAVTNMNLRENLRRQSIVDALTGLYNRRFLNETLERELVRANRQNTPLSLVMLDVDHFKRFNDNHGHEAGDQVLRHIAQLLLKSLRGSDLACRFGGEELTLIMPETDQVAALAKCELLREQIAQLTVRVGGVVLPAVTISMGLAVYPRDGEQADTLIQHADAALYRAKNDGRNRVEVARVEE
ncbi:GGDEF domain-containing protein [Chitinimonas sp. BJB300]|uniref:GGDEF domain-containing protein n=1 Tax=Chitinimonas sp. BJB300 TaxID=1559339 RepID=UPI0011123CF1|nr:GGDEF domain-containing protein [Chitinimonas sp. BJB300]TSJ88155.1 GGDEF domain-containing protein [Chitinimonas sp. BJB300]